MNEEVVHRVVHFSGHVQGVGFRYSTLQVAKEFEVSGNVRNLADGRVRMEAVGEETQVRAFIDRVKDQLSSYIRETDEKKQEPPGQFKGFSIL